MSVVGEVEVRDATGREGLVFGFEEGLIQPSGWRAAGDYDGGG